MGKCVKNDKRALLLVFPPSFCRTDCKYRHYQRIKEEQVGVKIFPQLVQHYVYTDTRVWIKRRIRIKINVNTK